MGIEILYVLGGVVMGMLIVLASGITHDTVTVTTQEPSPWDSVSTVDAMRIIARYEIPYLDEEELKQCRKVAARIMNMRKVPATYKG